MSIRRDDIDTMDFSDVCTRGALAPVSPGDVLLHDFLEPLGMSANALARALNVPANRITGILHGTRALTADTALRLERYFGMSAGTWLALQKDFELRTAQATIGRQINRDKKWDTQERTPE